MAIIHTLLTHYVRWLYHRHMQLQPISEELPHPREGKKYLLYIHIPFCESLCPFCSFHRVKLSIPMAERYFDALRSEIQLYHAAGFEISDVYVGGGTPTVIPKELSETLELVRRLFGIRQISVETNPNHLRQEYLEPMLEVGVNRLSVGVQSLENSLLKEMQRFQPYGSAAEIVERLKTTQGLFETFNVDMMFNFPHQSMDSLLSGIDKLKAIAVDQLTLYPLMPALTTQKALSQQIGDVEFQREAKMYAAIREQLLPQYLPETAWSFARHPTRAIDEYIVEHDEYLGVGSGSFSYLNGVIYANSFSINRYIDLVGEGRAGVVASHALTIAEQVHYFLLLQLFGLSMNKAMTKQRLNKEYWRLLRMEMKLFEGLGFVEETDNSYRLSQAGMYYWVMLMREFFIGVNNLRAQMVSLDTSR